MEINADDQVLSPHESDIFVVVHKNDYKCAYLIGHMHGTGYFLCNMHSGATNYKGKTIEALINVYLEHNCSGINPITHYFFMKHYHCKIDCDRPFGHTKVTK